MGITQIYPNAGRNPQPPTTPVPPLRPVSKGTTMQARLLRSIRVHKFTVALVSLVVLGLGVGFLIIHKPSYASRSLIYVSPTFPKTLSEDPETEHPYDSYMQQQVHSVTRYDVIADAIRSLPQGTWQQPGESEQSAVLRLQHSLEVNRVEMTYQIAITLFGNKPNHLAEIVNAVTQSYLAKTQHEEFYGRDERLATLRDTRDDLQKQLDAKLQEQAAITQKLGVAVIGSGDATNPFDDQLSKVRADLSTAHEQRIEAEAQLVALQSGDPLSPNSTLNAEADAVISNDPQLLAMRATLGQKRSALMEQLAGLTPNNPLRKQTEADLAQIDNGLNEMQNDMRRKAAMQLEQKLHANVSRASVIESQLQQELQKDSAAANTAAPGFQRADELKADIDRQQMRYTQVDNRISDLELESSSPGSVHLFSAAMRPFAPEPSKVRMLSPLLLPIALLLGMMAAVIFDFLDPHIYTSEDIEGVLGFAPIGSLFANGDVTQLMFDECVLRLAAAVDHSARLAGVHTFVMTSTDAQAGTTTTVENLAYALASLGSKVITIDSCGNANPVAYVAVGLNDTNYQTSLSHPTASLRQPTTAPSLHTPTVNAHTLPGRVTPLPSFVNNAFKNLTNDYDVVLIDAAPLLSSAETEYLARCADVTILLTCAGKTTKAKLLRAARLLERLDVPGTATVINKVSLLRVDKSIRNDVREFEERSETTTSHLKTRFHPYRVGESPLNQNPEQTVSQRAV
jgi:uncharacterized protein involved in exopolysaccharide biosynthesis/Mrp family chromosome partitioning ATPase